MSLLLGIIRFFPYFLPYIPYFLFVSFLVPLPSLLNVPFFYLPAAILAPTPVQLYELKGLGRHRTTVMKKTYF
jgi:hypothetical protein